MILHRRGVDGLSPPARGSRRPPRRCPTPPGPIPARAGEPRTTRGPLPRTWAYPRPRGGARSRFPPRSVVAGLSPPARGSRGHQVGVGRHRGPIPARAGEPEDIAGGAVVRTAYPRPRGGAKASPSMRSISEGLSPPARGSPAHSVVRRAAAPPIPARAGEPPESSPRARERRAYPRPRGGATSSTRWPAPAAGLSPPARGSHDRDLGLGSYLRPIPARAGEPPPPTTTPRVSTAYPRPRGGAVKTPGAVRDVRGLSPPARGSLHNVRRAPR